jgi:Zn-dependent protease
LFGRAWRIGKIGGIDIRVDSSWVFLAIFIVYSWWVSFTSPPLDISSGTGLALAVGAAFLFFGSVLAHELAHAGMARARGLPVSDITLFLFGGATSTSVEDRGPADEFLVTVVGPLTSLAVGGVYIWIAQLPSLSPPVAGAIDYLGRLNILLAIFNVLPGFPLDGGRILRSAVWKVTGSRERATAVAARVGVGMAVILIGFGIWQIALNGVYGFWLAFIGWFLLQSSRSAVRRTELRKALAAGRAEDAMSAPPPAIPADMSLMEALDRYLQGHEDEAFPVQDHGRLAGFLTFDSARSVGGVDPLRPVRDAIVPLDRMQVVSVDEPLDRVADRVGGGQPAVVVRDGEVVGKLTASDLGRWLGSRAAR